MINEHDQVVVVEDLTDLPVRAGDIGTVVHVYEEGTAYELEFISLPGRPLALRLCLPRGCALSSKGKSRRRA